MAKKAAGSDQTTVIELPIGEAPNGEYCTNRIDVRLDDRQRRAAKRLLTGMNAVPVKLANGRFVQNVNDVVRFILEQVA